MCALHGQGWWLGRLYLYAIAEMTGDIAGNCCHFPGAVYSLSDPFTERVTVKNLVDILRTSSKSQNCHMGKRQFIMVML